MTALPESKPPSCKPFLKWVGGKRRLLPEILRRVPASYHTYHEPFLGGGAAFFALRPKVAVLSDVNPDLVSAYLAVRDHCELLIRILRTMEQDYRRRGTAHYLEVRAWDSQKLENHSYAAHYRAARAIYLNKTCFNGVWRVNKAGKFNVPPGRFKTPPTICDEDNLRACSTALADARICCRDFRLAMEEMRSGDFAYLDPPYAPLSATSNFTSYAAGGFGPENQRDLARLTLEAKRRGASVLLSNSACEDVRKLYENPAFEISQVSMRRSVNCDAGKRSAVREYLIE